MEILLRSFGDSFGDLLTKNPAKDGLGFGTIGSSLVLLGILCVLIFFTIKKKNDQALGESIKVSTHDKS